MAKYLQSGPAEHLSYLAYAHKVRAIQTQIRPSLEQRDKPQFLLPPPPQAGWKFSNIKEIPKEKPSPAYIK